MASDSITEQVRAYHQELDQLERGICDELEKETKGGKEKLKQSYRVRRAVDTMQDRARKILKICKDEDGALQSEIDKMAGDDAINSFYKRLRELFDEHRGRPGMTYLSPEVDVSGEEVNLVFSGEEGNGKFVDMHALFTRFQNESFGDQSMGYAAFLGQVSGRFQSIPRRKKCTKAYANFLAGVEAYLCDFFHRTQPLADLEGSMQKVVTRFKKEWSAGEIEGWEDRGLGSSAAGAAPPLDLDVFSSTEEVESLGLEEITKVLTAMGLKAGGNLQQRAARLFSTKGIAIEKLDKKLFAKGRVPASALKDDERERLESSARAAALLEEKIHEITSKMLANIIEGTVANVARKQALTYEELQAEALAAEEDDLVESEEEEEEDVIYNPLKLPLGWDGKPIPYWLYKLHGLNQEFKCEICGNESYWGRRAFERHFTESKHQSGLKALGVSYKKELNEITSIDDAIRINKSIVERQKKKWNVATEEEFEDDEGNVYNKKTYDDLVRQGLI